MSRIAYLLDENVDPRLYRGLRRHWPLIGVWRVGDPDTPAFQTPDPEILLWCEARSVSLVTNNRRSMPVHLRDHLIAGRHVPGFFIMDESLTIGETVERLAAIWGASEAEEYTDC